MPNKKKAIKNLGEMISRIILDGFVLERTVSIGPGCGIITVPGILINKTVRICIIPIREKFLTRDDLIIKSKTILEETVSDMILNGLVYEKRVSKLGVGGAIYVKKEWYGKHVRVIILPVNKYDSLASEREMAELRIKEQIARKQLTKANNKIAKLESDKYEEESENKENKEEIEVPEENLEDEDAY